MMAPGDRIAYSSDGNKRDEDDVGATPMSLALLDAAGEKNKLVYFGCAALPAHGLAHASDKLVWAAQSPTSSCSSHSRTRLDTTAL